MAIKGQEIISADDVKGIFGIVEVIAKQNSNFLKELGEKMSAWDQSTTLIGDLCLNSLAGADKLKVYSRYIINYDTTVSVYGKCMKENSKFAEFVEVCFVDI